MGSIGKFLIIISYRKFLKLWLSQLASQPASHILNFTLVIRIFDLTGSTLMASLYVAVASVAPILFSTPAGIIADSFNRRNLLMLVHFLRALMVLVIFVFSTDAWSILFLAFLMSAVSQIAGPSENASIPHLVPGSKLFLANSFSLLTGYASFLIGYAVAGPLLFYLDNSTVFIIITSSFLLASFISSLLPILDQHLKGRERIGLNIKEGFGVFWGKLKGGLWFIRKNKIILLIMIQIAYIFSLERSFIALVPAFAERFLNFDVKEISYFLIVPTALGAVSGAVIANWAKKKFSKSSLINFGLYIDAIGLILLSFYQHLDNFLIFLGIGASLGFILTAYVVILAIFSGIADPLEMISAQTFFQEKTPAIRRGRIFGGLVTLMNLVGLAPILAIGVLSNIYSIGLIIFILGAVTLGIALTSTIIYKRKWYFFN